MSYRVAAPDEYLAITGMCVRDELKITKAAWVWPFQRCVRFRWASFSWYPNTTQL